MAEFLDRAQPWATTLILHNWPVLLYTVLAAIAATWALIRPARSTLLILYGAIILIVGFEYEKHGTATIINTTSYLFSVEVNPIPRVLSRRLLLEVVPISMQVIGYGLLLCPFANRLLARERRSHADSALSRGSEYGP